MTTIITAKQAIYSIFKTAWDLANPTNPLFIESGGQTPPVDTPYARIFVRHNTRAQESLGGEGARKFESQGFVVVQIFSPDLDEGSTPADNLALSAQSILEGKTLTSGGATVFTNSATINEIGETDDGYQNNVSTAFRYQQTK